MNQQFFELIEKYLKGECSAEEMKVLDDWYQKFDAETAPVEMSNQEIRAGLEELSLKRINEKIVLLESNDLEIQRRRNLNLKSVIYTLSGIAASLLLVWGLSTLNWQKKNQNLSRAVSQTGHFAQIKYVNNTKSIERIKLSDGSLVWLNPGSSLELYTGFKKESRNVTLSGMAFFQVTKNKARPFVITTNDIITKVWGTSFTVNAYPDRKLSRVSVLTGKVSVSLNGPAKTGDNFQYKNAVMLYPHQQATYFSGRNVINKSEIRPKTDEDLKIWKKVNLTFHDTKVSEVIKSLNQVFNVHLVTNDNKINNYLFLADLSEQDLPSILEILKTSLDLKYEISNNDITLRSND